MKTARQSGANADVNRTGRSERRAGPLARVLVVAEDERFQRLARRRLQSVGFDVVTTDDGIDALMAAHCDPPDLFVVDHVVRWMDVRYLLAQLRCEPHRAGIPVLLVAQSDADSLGSDYQALGVSLLADRTKQPQAAVPRLRVRKDCASRGAGAS